MTSQEDLDDLLVNGRRVKVWDAQHDSVFVEGEVIAYSLKPMLCVRDDNGDLHWHVADLPIDVRRVEWRPLGEDPKQGGDR